MKTSGWNIDVEVGKMPQKVATAYAELTENLVGVEYEPIAYLGSQVVNGVNHAVLAKQIIINGRDSENIVVLTFNEQNTGVVLVGITPVIRSGAPLCGVLGGVKLDVQTDIPEEAMNAFTDAYEGYVGVKVEPFALLGTQVVNGINYIFAAVLTGVTAEPEQKAVIVTVNPIAKTVDIGDMLDSKHEASLKYAFTW